MILQFEINDDQLAALTAAVAARLGTPETPARPLPVADSDPTNDPMFGEKMSEKARSAASAPPKAVAEPEPEPVAKPKAVPVPPAKVPVPEMSGAVCEVCGVPLSKAEEKTARLFVSKAICKKHLQEI